MHFSFSSFAEMVAFASKEADAKGEENASRRVDREKWSGVRYYEEAEKLAREGWAEGCEIVEGKRVKFSHLIGAKTRKAIPVLDVAGYYPNVPEFLAGNPECMTRRDYIDAEAVGKVVRIVLCLSASCGISPDVIISKGALVCALVDAIESTGARCEVAIGWRMLDTANNQWTSGICEVKAASEPLEMDRLSFALAHPAMLRRLIFSIAEHDAPFIARGRFGYGMPNELEEHAQGDIYVGASSLLEVNDRTAVAWAKKQLASVGIEFEEGH